MLPTATVRSSSLVAYLRIPVTLQAVLSTPRKRRLIAALAAAAFSSACTAGTPSASPTASSSPIPNSTVRPSSSIGRPTTCVQRVFAGMSEAQRVGQLFVLGLEGDKLNTSDVLAIRAHHFGSVTFVVTSTVGVHGIRSVADAVQSLASPEATAGVRFFVAANQEGGEIQALRGPGFSSMPSALTQGQLDPSILQADAAEWARELQSAGVNLNFAPVMDVVPPGTASTNQPVGVLQREFGHDPATVGVHGAAFIRGMKQAGVATTAKHFPGLGRVQGNTDFTADVVDQVTSAGDPFLQSFRQAIDAGVPFVMVALATYTKIDAVHLAAFSPAVMQLLRAQFHFNGVIVSDDIGAANAVTSIPPGQRGVDFLAAGGDMIVSKTLSPAVTMASEVLSRTESDGSFRAVVDKAALRVISAKGSAGLLPCDSL
jgi:beta-N-acetylhexosaminidase